MSANERQVGGVHYQGGYQHWDFVSDVGLGYHAGNATKYVARYHKKNGLQDLEKCLHYIDKCDELNVAASKNARTRSVIKFGAENGLNGFQTMCIDAIMWGDWRNARDIIERMAAPLRPAAAEQPKPLVAEHPVGDTAESG